MKGIFLYFLAFCFLAACNESKPKEEVSTDSTTTTSSVADTVKTTVLTAEDSAKLANAEFEKVFSRSVQILKSGKVQDLGEVIDPLSGLFLLFNGDGAYSAYQIFPDMSYMDTLGENDPAVSRLKTFTKTMSEAKDNEMVVQYADDVKDPSPCYFKRRGTFAIDFLKPKAILSDLYKSTQQMTGNDIDPDELKNLKKIENKIARVVILNIFKDGGQAYPETLYFTKQDGKWYLIGIDMIDCFSA
jgi:hypothetical protein